jgi:hypothetical protein
MKTAEITNNKMSNIEPPSPITAEPNMTERYVAAYMILFNKKPEWRQAEIENAADPNIPMNRHSTEFSKEVIELAESEEEGAVNEIDAFVVNLRLIEKTANNVPTLGTTPSAELPSKIKGFMPPFKFN